MHPKRRRRGKLIPADSLPARQLRLVSKLNKLKQQDGFETSGCAPAAPRPECTDPPLQHPCTVYRRSDLKQSRTRAKGDQCRSC